MRLPGPPATGRPTTSRLGGWVRRTGAGLLVAALAGGLLAMAPAPSYAANPVTPGDYTGLGFDQCEAPSESAMRAWRRSSPFRAAGIYISGASRACQRQANLTPTWVANQLADGWRLMPITLGPQASCSSPLPALRTHHRPDDQRQHHRDLRRRARRRAPPRPAARSPAPGRWASSGAARSSTTWRPSTPPPPPPAPSRPCGSCTRGPTSCTGCATPRASTPARRPASSCSTTPGCAAGNPITMPDQIWIADWDGRANTSSTCVRSTGWTNGGRAKQFQGGHDETWGGVRINIDRNYLDLRTPRLPGASSHRRRRRALPRRPAPLRRRSPAPRATPARTCRTRSAPRRRSASRRTSGPARCAPPSSSRCSACSSSGSSTRTP